MKSFFIVMNETKSNKRLAKNTFVLYIRMLFTLVLQLYTSRLVLQALGIENYGIYNVVGGVVTMLNFVNMSLSNADARFISVEIGRGIQPAITKVFSCIMSIHFIFAIIIFLFAETVGLYFLINKLVIPETRMVAAMWVYQSAVLSSLITIISTPYNGLIIAHEKMSAFAVISIFDAVAKFLLALLLFVSPIDRLIMYAVLHVFIQLMVRVIYVFYCKKKIEESNYTLMWDKSISRQVLSFAGWTLTGNVAVMGYTQGLNILLNMFFGAVVNAARGISVQVQAASRMFFTGFQTAINPQILKSYAQGNLERMYKLIIMSSRFSFYLMLLVTIPICLHTQYILELWLGDVPEYTAEFVQVMLAVGLLNTLQNPIMLALHATGKIKKVQIVESFMLLSVVPIAYIFLKYFNIFPVMVFIIYLIIESITQLVRVIMIYPRIKMPIIKFFSRILLPITMVTIVSLTICHFLSKLLKVNDFLSLCVATISYVTVILVVTWICGITKEERNYTITFIRSKLHL